MKVEVVSLFPEMIRDAAEWGVGGRALKKELVHLNCSTPREFATNVHQTVDDRPYGGGPGMVLQYEPMAAAVQAAKQRLPEGSPAIFLSPQGRVFNQKIARDMARLPGFVLVCGRYEGFDERLLEKQADEELSIGDFVISGGELAALAVMDAVWRLLPGVLGDDTSAEQDSFTQQRLDHPHYTRPEVVAGMAVPEVLLNGNHAEIDRWRLKQALGRTWQRRPDLLEVEQLTSEEQGLVQEYQVEHLGNRTKSHE